MAGKSATESSIPPGSGDSPEADAGIYIDSSALAKLYVPEPESERLDRYLRGRRGLIISDLAITEIVSAVARRKREGELQARHANKIREALLHDVDSGMFARQDLTRPVHREAERLLLAAESVPLRTLDALHIALALSGAASHVLTFDQRMAQAVEHIGLQVIEGDKCT